MLSIHYNNFVVKTCVCYNPLIKEVNKVMAIKRRPEESVDSMLRRFKKEVLKAEIIKDLRKHEYYIAPSEKRRMKSNEARKRAMKKQSKQNDW